jgi:Arc/MetJ-type ribon-helix-helix transcriptional regulator
MTVKSQAKKGFATRLSPQTLARLDELIRSGRFKSRTAAIEAAVERLVEAEHEEYERKRRALDEVCGVLHLGIDRERLEAAELDRLEYEVWKNTGKR